MNTPQRVVDCYSILDCFARFGWTDFTEGIYPTPETSYEEAQKNQTSYILDQLDLKNGHRLIDIGCGNGRLIAAALQRGIGAVGITVSPEQAEKNNAAGLPTFRMDYRNIPCQWANGFDGLVANGSIEHFVQIEEALAGKQDDIYKDMFRVFARLLKQGGRAVTTVIHFRLPVDPRTVARGPGAFMRGTAEFHCARLVADFGGFYPTTGHLLRSAAPYFRHEKRVDGTRDYELTSLEWLKMMRRILLKPGFWPRFSLIAMKHPRHAIGFLDDLLISKSWLRQFQDWRGKGTPTQLFRDTWQRV